MLTIRVGKERLEWLKAKAEVVILEDLIGPFTGLPLGIPPMKAEFLSCMRILPDFSSQLFP